MVQKGNSFSLNLWVLSNKKCSVNSKLTRESFECNQPLTEVLPEATTGQREKPQKSQNHPEGQQGEHIEKGIQTQEEAKCHQLTRKIEIINIHSSVIVIIVFYIYLLKLLGDAEASVDPFPALCIFGLIMLKEVASGEFSSYESEQGKI